MKKLFILLCTLSSIATFSQVAADIEYNNVRARVNNNGSWFYDMANQRAGYFVPKDENIASIFSTGFWMGGLVTDQSLNLAALQYGEGTEYSVGPISNNSSTLEFLDKYNHIWRISHQEILTHQANYASPNYEMPWAIATWPGNGNAANGEAQLLAPFVDLNSDGIYSPAQGDYPDIRGDEALYFMMNDYNHLHEVSEGGRIGVNIHAMTYAYTDVAGSPLNDCVFVSLKIRNERTQILSDFYIGIFNEFDLGNAFDDYVASDSLRNMMYVYNGYDFDESQPFLNGYGNYLPAQGCMFLNYPMTKGLCFYNGVGGPNEFPIQSMHYYNYMRGIWKDNTFVTEGGNGYGGTTPANFMFSGDPVTNSGWTEANAGMGPHDRRIIMSTGPFTFLPGEQLCIDVAFPFARSAQQNNALDAIVELREAADFIQNFYDSQNHDCAMQVVGVEEHTTLGNVAVYPNPSNGRFTVSSYDEIKYVEVYDGLGKRVLTKNATRNNSRAIEVDLSKEPKGVYLYQVYDEDGKLQSGKVILQ